MKCKKIVYPILVSSLAFFSCGNKQNQKADQKQMTEAINETNPLLQDWQGANGGVPPFDKIKVEHFKPALRLAMDEQWKDVQAIINNQDKPTFDNTIKKLEKSGKNLDRIMPIYGVWSLTMSDSVFQGIEQEIDPQLAALSDKIQQNSKLFKRIEKIYESKESLIPEQQRLVELLYKDFVKSGVNLDSIRKAKVSEINQELAVLFSKFGQNLLADETENYVAFEDEQDVAGLPESFLNASAEAAKIKGTGKWLVQNTRSSVDPFLTYAENREARKEVWEMFVNRGDNDNKNDNNNIISKIVKLRTQRAKLLGYESHAHFRLDGTMAKTPENAMKLMEDVWKYAKDQVKEEVAEMQAIANKEGNGIKIEPWDYHYYSEKVRIAKYDLDQNKVKEYLQLEEIRKAMFWVAEQLFGYHFTLAEDIPVYHPDVRVWEMKQKETGNHIGYWYFDPYARKGKRSGAWMMDYRAQSKFDGTVTSIVSNNSNFVNGKNGDPVLLSWDDAETMFHEFGHALHGLSSDVTYPSLSGTSVVRDYVEFPSQILERWLLVPDVLKNFAVNYKTGKTIPDELIAKIKKASTFKEGFKTAEYLASGLVDMKLHMANIEDLDADKYEKRILREIGLPTELVMRHRLPQFAHLFTSDGYSAGYYSYLWAEVLSADAFDAFVEAGNYFDKEVADRLYKFVFSAGNTADPAQGYKMFRGRDPKPEALMKDKGFIK